MTTTSPDPTALQATLVDFALAELVRANRSSFEPLWSAESWAKLLIWLALNCGCSGDREGLEAFAAALGPALTGRMRRLFFERELFVAVLGPFLQDEHEFAVEPIGGPIGRNIAAVAPDGAQLHAPE